MPPRSQRLARHALVAALCLMALGPASALARTAGRVPAGAVALGALDAGDPRVIASLAIDHDAVAPGGTLRVGVHFAIDPDWHIYWRNSGDAGLATSVQFQSPGATFGPLQWPAPKAFEDPSGTIATFGYAEAALLWSEARVSPKAQGDVLWIVAEVDYLACKIDCIPGKAHLERAVTLGNTVKSAEFAAFETAASLLPRTPAELGVSVRHTVDKGSGGEAMAHLTLECKGCALDVLTSVPRHAFIPDEGLQVAWTTREVARSPSKVALSLGGRPSPDGVREPCALRGVVWVAKDGKPAPMAVDERYSCAALSAPGAGSAPAPHDSGPGPVVPPSNAPASSTPPSPAAPAPLHLAWVLLLAFLGGAILNLMPCVFPVLALKVFGFVRMAQSSRSGILAHTGAWTAGVMAAMLGLAAVVVGLRLAGTQVGWGFQFQEPLFIAALCTLLVLFALNLFGVFELSFGLTRRADGEHSLRASAAEGVLAVVLATPCSAPLLGTAVGFALSASPLVIGLVFGAVGLGLSAPFAALALVPGLSARLPRPGPWMLVVKQLLGFALLATVIWLLWILGQSTGAGGVIGLLAVLLACSLGAFGYGHVQFRSAVQKWPVTIAAVLLVASVGALALPLEPARAAASQALPEGPWQPWSEAAVAQAQQQGHTVFVDFTADWCITCKVNEQGVLASSSVQALFVHHGVVLLKADWTRRDEAIRATLARFGKAGVPLYLVYPPYTGEPQVLPEILTSDMIAQALERARHKR